VVAYPNYNPPPGVEQVGFADPSRGFIVKLKLRADSPRLTTNVPMTEVSSRERRYADGLAGLKDSRLIKMVTTDAGWVLRPPKVRCPATSGIAPRTHSVARSSAKLHAESRESMSWHRQERAEA